MAIDIISEPLEWLDARVGKNDVRDARKEVCWNTVSVHSSEPYSDGSRERVELSSWLTITAIRPEILSFQTQK